MNKPTHEDLDEPAGDLAVLGQEERELRAPPQLAGDAEVGQGDLAHGDALRLLAEPVDDLHAQLLLPVSLRRPEQNRVNQARNKKKYFSNSSEFPLLTFLAAVAKILALTASFFASGTK